MKIITYEDRYRDDLFFMILEAKNALGRVPGINSDLLDIEKNYFDNGDMFWLAVDENYIKTKREKGDKSSSWNSQRSMV